MRALVFFVWQRREAPKEWPWLMKNQRWVSPHINTSLFHQICAAGAQRKNRTFFTFSVSLVKLESWISTTSYTYFDRPEGSWTRIHRRADRFLLDPTQPTSWCHPQCMPQFTNASVCVATFEWLLLTDCVCLFVQVGESLCTLQWYVVVIHASKPQYFLSFFLSFFILLDLWLSLHTHWTECKQKENGPQGRWSTSLRYILWKLYSGTIYIYLNHMVYLLLANSMNTSLSLK